MVRRHLESEVPGCRRQAVRVEIPPGGPCCSGPNTCPPTVLSCWYRIPTLQTKRLGAESLSYFRKSQNLNLGQSGRRADTAQGLMVASPNPECTGRLLGHPPGRPHGLTPLTVAQFNSVLLSSTNSFQRLCGCRGRRANAGWTLWGCGGASGSVGSG